MNRVDHLSDVPFLKGLDVWVERQDLVIDDRLDPDPIDVIGRVEWMTFDVVRRRAEVKRPAIEEHHGRIDTGIAGSDHALSQSIEECRVEQFEVEFGVAVLGGSGPAADPRCGVMHRWKFPSAAWNLNCSQRQSRMKLCPRSFMKEMYAPHSNCSGVSAQSAPGPMPSWKLFQI